MTKTALKTVGVVGAGRMGTPITLPRPVAYVSLTAQRSEGNLRRRCSIETITVLHEGTSGQGRVDTGGKISGAALRYHEVKGGEDELEQKGNGPCGRDGARGARCLRAGHEQGGFGVGVLRQVLAGICACQ